MSGLLERVLEAHGADRFAAAREIEVDLSCGGFAFAMRFKRGALSRFRGRVDTREPRVVLSPFPSEGLRGVFERDRVRIEHEDGTAVSERTAPRAEFRKLRRKLWWDDLDLLYFAGYALWNYITTPFLLARDGFEVEEDEPWMEDEETWHTLRVSFPPDVPTHSREQRFYFDDAGRLRRLDYTAEVFGSWAKAAHYCHDHTEFDGLLVPTRRRVVPRRRNNRPAPGPTLVWIEIRGVSLA